MPMPEGIGAVDLMIGFPTTDPSKHYEFLRQAAKDQGSQEMEFPVEYMFKNVPGHLPEGADPVETALGEMDRCGVAIGMIGSPYGRLAQRALTDHPDRFFAALEVDPNDITGAVRKIREAKADHDIKAVTTFPAGCIPRCPWMIAATTRSTRRASTWRSPSSSTRASPGRGCRRNART